MIIFRRVNSSINSGRNVDSFDLLANLLGLISILFYKKIYHLKINKNNSIIVTYINEL